MQREKVLNFVAIIFFVVFVTFSAFFAFLAFEFFNSTYLSPFVLKAKWKVQGLNFDLAFSPKSDLLAAFGWAYGQDAVILWQTSTRQMVHSWVVSPLSYGFSYLLDFSPDGCLLAVGHDEQDINKVSVFKTADGRKLRTIVMGKGYISSIIFAPDGQLAINQNERLWFVQVDSSKKFQTKIQARRVVFSPDGRLIAACRRDRIDIFDGKRRLVQQLKVAKASSIDINIDKAIFSQDGQKFVCLWWEWKEIGMALQRQWWISIWRTGDWKLERSQPLTPFQLSTRLIGQLEGEINLNVSLVAITEPLPTGWDGLLWRLDLLVTPIIFHSGLRISPPPSQVSLYRLEDGQLVAKLPRFGRDVEDIAFSPDGRYLAVSHGDWIVLWELRGSGK